MPSSYLPHVRDRLLHLTETLHQLKARVREAVATELGRVVSDAVRDLLTAAMRGPVVELPRHRPVARPHWSDEDDDRRGPTHPHALADQPAAATRVNWPAAVSAGVLAAKWLWRRRFAAWSCLGLGLAVCLAALTGHPVVRTALDTVATAAEVVDVTHFDRT